MLKKKLLLTYTKVDAALEEMNHQKYLLLTSFKSKLTIIPKKYSEERGFSLPLFLVIAFVLLIGGATIANRAAESVFSSSYGSRAREAKKAAEAGATFLVAQLNAPVNRRLLVYQPGDTEISRNSFSSTTAFNLLRRNACLNPASNPDYSKIYPSGVSSSKWFIQPDGSISTSPSNLSFRLHRFQRESIDGLSISRNRPLGGTSRFVMQIVGESLRNGSVVATATLEQDWDVVPKCCRVGFGGAHGSADYGLDSDSESLCTLDNLGLGILAGAAGTETGAITIKGKSTEVVTSEGDAIDPIYCLSTTGSGCSISVTSADINVETIPEELPPTKSMSSPAPSTLTAPIPTSLGSISGCTTKSKSTTVTCGSFTFTGSATDSSSFAYCSDSSCDYTVINPSASTIPPFCAIGTSSLGSELHCNIGSINPGSGKNIVFNTSSRRIVLYFPTSGTKIASAGSGVVGHCALSTGSFSSKAVSSACGTPANATRLSMFGCQTCGTQSLTLNGTPALDLNAFVYFPNGQVSLAGTADISGIIWANTLSSSGSPTWTVPGSGVGSVLDLMGLLPDGSDITDKNPLLYDMVARSLNRTRWIANP